MSNHSYTLFPTIQLWIHLPKNHQFQNGDNTGRLVMSSMRANSFSFSHSCCLLNSSSEGRSWHKIRMWFWDDVDVEAIWDFFCDVVYIVPSCLIFYKILCIVTTAFCNRFCTRFQLFDSEMMHENDLMMKYLMKIMVHSWCKVSKVEG